MAFLIDKWTKLDKKRQEFGWSLVKPLSHVWQSAACPFYGKKESRP